MYASRGYPLASTRDRRVLLADPSHFGPLHPLARIALGRCVASGHTAAAGTACGACWEGAVRDDERFVVECDLPRDLVADPGDIDEIAVERACSGDDVRLTRPELEATVARLRERGWSCGRIGRRLRRDGTVITRIVARLAATDRRVA